MYWLKLIRPELCYTKQELIFSLNCDCKLVLLHSEFKCEHSVFGQTHASDGILITSVFCFFLI